ncbi:uncharacterized protein LOC125561399 [Nematostella vectensis]|uniref:uncharacterized protein LOC116608472 n=1 Tax=Nematostella vectensis TaxID=45351 RepID=UPI002076E5E0|nr:uncharacterized protein LOC116608472 [Nematostella vectensis]XP_048576532.1 uncharacterized protein LOC125558964 [Nematostella vectensis]XP_048581710.1 uncharacterized protein LOC125561399 [Nematostella vectensis]
MVGEKDSSTYRKKRKRVFYGKQKQELNRSDRDESSQTTRGLVEEPGPSHSRSADYTPDHSEQAPASASRKKLSDHGYNESFDGEFSSDDQSLSKFDSDHEEVSGDDAEACEYRVVDLGCLSSYLSDVHRCEEGKLEIKETTSARAGLKSSFEVKCSSCHETETLTTSSQIHQRGKSFDVNRRVVYHSLESGNGYEGLASFCRVMNMPCVSKAAYYKQLDIIVNAQEEEGRREMCSAAKRLRQKLIGDDGKEFELLDVAVSFDGTWAKRGFTSLTGVVFAISIDTGEVLDYHVLSKQCQTCTINRGKISDDGEFEDWILEHVASGACDINFVGSSPAMEAEGAVVLWSRSIERHNMRYKWMICDGDSKSHNSVQDIYDECRVEKLDCVGHVQKRMGKRLLQLKSRRKGKLDDGHTIGGRGRLTEAKIKKLQKEYGLAIRQNTVQDTNPTERDIDVAVYAMKKNIIASLHHNIGMPDLKKQHQYCPKGANSWCKFQQDEATGTSSYDSADCLPEVFLEVLRPVYMSLSETDLLKRCVRGKTQNPNECINSLVWARCPKHKHHGPKVVRFAAASAVCHFHGGAASREKVMESLLIPAGSHTKQGSLLKDRKRVQKADRQVSEKAKKKRQATQMRRVRREEALRSAEGVTYESGAF